jgi:hypothetical protein
MKTFVVLVTCCITIAAILAYGQSADPGYQTARVVSIEKLAYDGKVADVDRYKISMRMNDLVYACRSSAPAATFMEWVVGKEFPAKEDGKVLLVKNRNGQIVQLDIASKKRPK